jgi:hypothetical protein
MTWHTSQGMARIAGRIRFGLLAGIALLVGHDAVYAAEHGIGRGYGSAMTALGHDAYWLPVTGLGLLAAIGLALASVLAIGRLQRRLHGIRSRRPIRSISVAYRRELGSLYPPLFLAVVALFTLQENIETILARGDLPGVDVLLGGPLPLAIPVLGLVSLAVAAVGALVRWRIATLQARLRGALHAARPEVGDARPAREWAEIGAAAPHRWILDRRDAGRAPPLVLPA